MLLQVQIDTNYLSTRTFINIDAHVSICGHTDH